jgi:hypothetical protein
MIRGIVSSKLCRKCGASNVPFYRNSQCADGLDYQCAKCRNAATMRWRNAKPERIDQHRAEALADYYLRKQHGVER